MQRRHVVVIVGILVALIVVAAALGWGRAGAGPEGVAALRPEVSAPVLAVRAEEEVRSLAMEREFAALAATGLEMNDTPSVAAPPRTWQASSLPNHSVRLSVGEDEELPLEAVTASVHIDGFRARVRLDLAFYNPHRWSLEGVLRLRLPEGASPHALAFGGIAATFAGWGEADGAESGAHAFGGWIPELGAGDAGGLEVREAKMVQRVPAARVFRDTVAQRVDPALMAWSGPSIFTTRVYPLEPEQMHLVRLVYDVDLAHEAGGLTYRLELPAARQVREAEVVVQRVAGAAVAVAPQGVRQRGEAEDRYRYAEAPERIEVRQHLPGGVVLAGGLAGSGDYFSVDFEPDLAPRAVSGSSQAVFLVDTSLSASPEAFGLWLALLAAILEENRAPAGSGIEAFAVAFFDVDVHWWRPAFVANTPEQVAALLAYAEGLSLEGATDLGRALRAGAQPAWLGAEDVAAWDLFLLSDGHATWGEDDPWALAAAVTSPQVAALYAYEGGAQRTDRALLQRLVRAGGGALFSLRAAEGVAAAARAHQHRPYPVLGVSVEGGHDLLLHGDPAALYPGQRLRLSGRGRPAPGAVLRLHLVGATGESRQDWTLALGQVVSSGTAPRLFGEEALRRLEPFGGHSAAWCQPLARHFRVVGRSASLLMLETEEEYAPFALDPEGDAALARTLEVGQAEATAQAALAALLSDAKGRFVARFEALTAPESGLHFYPREDFLALVAAMDGEAFAAVPPGLGRAPRRLWEVPAAYVAMLAGEELDHRVLLSEVARLAEAGDAAAALRAYSSLVERRSGDAVVGRELAYFAIQAGWAAEAVPLLWRVQAARPWEAQTYHLLGLALAGAEQTSLALVAFEWAMAGRWDSRFGDFRSVVRMDYGRFLRTQLLVAEGVSAEVRAYGVARLAELEAEHGAATGGLVVTLTWNTDNTDVDLHVIEPSGTEVYYRQPKSASGGALTKDVTDGYGPEMYVHPTPERGSYRVQAKYFSADAGRLSTRTQVLVTIYQHLGQADEQVIRVQVPLEGQAEVQEVASVVWP